MKIFSCLIVWPGTKQTMANGQVSLRHFFNQKCEILVYNRRRENKEVSPHTTIYCHIYSSSMYTLPVAKLVNKQQLMYVNTLVPIMKEFFFEIFFLHFGSKSRVRVEQDCCCCCCEASSPSSKDSLVPPLIFTHHQSPNYQKKSFLNNR